MPTLFNLNLKGLNSAGTNENHLGLDPKKINQYQKGATNQSPTSIPKCLKNGIDDPEDNHNKNYIDPSGYCKIM